MDGILIEDLNEQTSLAESDNLIVGGSDANKITVANVITALKDLGLLNELGNKIFYATCSTEADTAAKVATCINDGFELVQGVTVAVMFTNANTVSSPTLNVNDTGDLKMYMGSTSSGYITSLGTYYWRYSDVVMFTYTGSNWRIIGKSIATTTFYGETKLTDSVSSTSTTTAATPNSVKTAYDLANGKQDALTFDETPTEGSTNPVTSGGVYDALADAGGGADALTANENILLGKTGNYTGDEGSSDSPISIIAYSVAVTYFSRTFAEGYCRIEWKYASSSSRYHAFYIGCGNVENDGTTYTFSMRIRLSSVPSGDLKIILGTYSISVSGTSITPTVTEVSSVTIATDSFTAGEWCDVQFTFTTVSGSTINSIIFESYTSENGALFASGDTVDIAWMKLEEGDTATMWIPNADSIPFLSTLLSTIKDLESRVATLEG